MHHAQKAGDKIEFPCTHIHRASPDIPDDFFNHIIYALNVVMPFLTAILPLIIPFPLANNCIWDGPFL